MKCPDCGSENKDNAIFCKICGAPLKVPRKSDFEDDVMHEEPLEESLKASNDDLSNSNLIEESDKSAGNSNPIGESDKSAGNSNPIGESDKSSGNKNTLIICITAIICIAIIAGAFLIMNGDFLSNSTNDSVGNGSDTNQVNITKNSSSGSGSSLTNEMNLEDAKKLMKGSSNTVIRNTFDEADANGNGVLTGSEIDRFKYLADLTGRTADTSNTEHVEASEQGAGDGSTKTRYCTTHGRVAVGDDNRCPYCEAEGLDSRTVKGSTEYI